MTYTALLSLLILEDDLSRLNRVQILSSISKCQQTNGSFAASHRSKECDMRFLFCACAISYILGDWTGIDIKKAIEYISKSKNYDGGYGVGPAKESHGGSTYCVVASLALLNRLDILTKNSLLHWLISKQNEGFHGRINKPDDTCYGFWIGSCLDVKLSLIVDYRKL